MYQHIGIAVAQQSQFIIYLDSSQPCLLYTSHQHAPAERTPRELLGWSQAAMTQEMAHLVPDIGIPVKYAGQ